MAVSVTVGDGNGVSVKMGVSVGKGVELGAIVSVGVSVRVAVGVTVTVGGMGVAVSEGSTIISGNGGSGANNTPHPGSRRIANKAYNAVSFFIGINGALTIPTLWLL